MLDNNIDMILYQGRRLMWAFRTQEFPFLWQLCTLPKYYINERNLFKFCKQVLLRFSSNEMGNTQTIKHHECPITLSQLKYLPKKWNVSQWKQTTVVNYTFLSFCGLTPRVNSFCPEYANSIRHLTNLYAPDLQKWIWNFAASSLCSENKYIHLIMQSETLWLLYF